MNMMTLKEPRLQYRPVADCSEYYLRELGLRLLGQSNHI